MYIYYKTAFTTEEFVRNVFHTYQTIYTECLVTFFLNIPHKPFFPKCSVTHSSVRSRRKLFFTVAKCVQTCKEM